jgi:hypothetical protein
MVTAEAAVVLPLVAFWALAMVWVVTLGIAEIRVVDAARDAARAVARGDGTSAAVRAAERTAGRAAEVDVHRGEGMVQVSVSRRVAAPSWLLVPLPSVTVRSRSSVEDEGAQATR